MFVSLKTNEEEFYYTKNHWPRTGVLCIRVLRFTAAWPIPGIMAVSYTHLDVYKRQVETRVRMGEAIGQVMEKN